MENSRLNDTDKVYARAILVDEYDMRIVQGGLDIILAFHKHKIN